MQNKKRNLIITAVTILLNLIILKNAYCFAVNRRLLFFMGTAVLVWILLWRFSKKYNSLLDRLCEKICTIPAYYKNNKRSIFADLLQITFIIFFSGIISYIISSMTNFSFNYILFSGVMCVLLVLYVTWKFKNNLYNKLHCIFFACAMICGCFYIFCMPAEVVMGWDEHIHFDNAITIVNNIGGYSSSADSIVMNRVYEKDSDFYSADARKNNEDLYNSKYESHEVGEFKNIKFGATTIAYVPYAVGVIIGRGLLMPYTSAFRFGKLINLLFYCTIVSFAISKTKNNKIIFAGLGILPTVLFMASSFSYDAWVLCFTLLGYSLYLNCIEEKNLTKSRMLQILICFGLGILIKAVYFPIMIPLLFAPNSIFEKSSDKKIFRIGIIITMLILLLSFALPMLINSGSQTDARGGTDVNSAEQVKFILSNPLKYAEIYFRYLATFYLIPSHSYGFIQAYAYLGNGITNVIPLILLIGLILFTKSDCNHSILNTALSWISSFISLTLVVTALYVSFTPVGLDTVNGCQFRYMIPLLYPILASTKGGYIKKGKYAGQYGTFVVAFMALSMIVFMADFMLIRL